jgi:hypothetical protein
MIELSNSENMSNQHAESRNSATFVDPEKEEFLSKKSTEGCHDEQVDEDCPPPFHDCKLGQGDHIHQPWLVLVSIALFTVVITYAMITTTVKLLVPRNQKPSNPSNPADQVLIPRTSVPGSCRLTRNVTFDVNDVGVPAVDKIVNLDTFDLLDFQVSLAPPQDAGSSTLKVLNSSSLRCDTRYDGRLCTPLSYEDICLCRQCAPLDGVSGNALYMASSQLCKNAQSSAPRGAIIFRFLKPGIRLLQIGLANVRNDIDIITINQDAVASTTTVQVPEDAGGSLAVDFNQTAEAVSVVLGTESLLVTRIVFCLLEA